ncbi:hypothetical protein [Roseivirga sp. UBA1976]|uniref:hypothetical protein n=1 Tax=Roseivirga sp. UBA1976 TaxID=1947386 RepID=UPI00257B3746|nr:hypothetical protein [Roseivirga sp. UBA1976]|tara:strand:- start:1602 stop:3719 length:2118 start_codon:yes stop_codon:yes gene_type:complete
MKNALSSHLLFFLISLVLFNSCREDIVLPIDQKNQMISDFFDYNGSSTEVLDAILDFRSRYDEDVIKDIVGHAGYPAWDEVFKLSSQTYMAGSSSADTDSSFDVEYQFPVLHKNGDRVEALLVYFNTKEGEKFWKIFSRKHYESFDFKTKHELQPLLVIGQFLAFDHKMFGVNSVDYGEYIVQRTDQHDVSQYEPCEPGEFGCNCDEVKVVSARTGEVLTKYYKNCKMLIYTVTPDGQGDDDLLEQISSGDPNNNDVHYYWPTPVSYIPTFQSYLPQSYTIYFQQIFVTGTGATYVNDYSSNPENLLEHINLESDADLDLYLRDGPSNTSRSEVSFYLLQMSNKLYEHDNSREYAYSLNELARSLNVSDQELYDLALMARDTYVLLSDNAFDYDLLSYQDQRSVAQTAFTLDIFPEVKAQVGDTGWPLSAEEWGALWEIFKPMLGELLLESLPGGGITLAFRDAVTGINNGDAFLIAGAVTGLILEFVPPGKIFKAVWRTGRVVRKGFKFVKYGRKYLDEIGLALEKGLKADIDGNIVRISKNGDEVARVTNNVLTFKYTGFGGDIITVPNKTTTIIGKWENQIENIWNTGLAKQGSNKGGMNILANLPNGSVDEKWEFNKNWLNQAISRGDEIRVTADPLNINNVFYDTNNISSSVFTSISHLKSYLLSLDNDRVNQLGYYGREVRYLFQNGYNFDDFSKKFIK